MIIEISNNELVFLIVLFVICFFVYKKYFSTEGFSSTKWGDKIYYNNEENEYPVTPSIVSYDIDRNPEKIETVKPINNPVESVKQNPIENINQTGANLDEVFHEEKSLMKPLDDIESIIRPESNIEFKKEEPKKVMPKKVVKYDNNNMTYALGLSIVLLFVLNVD